MHVLSDLSVAGPYLILSYLICARPLSAISVSAISAVSARFPALPGAPLFQAEHIRRSGGLFLLPKKTLYQLAASCTCRSISVQRTLVFKKKAYKKSRLEIGPQKIRK